MIGREDHDRVAQPDMGIYKVQQFPDLLIDAQSHVHRFLAVWPKAMADIVVRGKTYGQYIRVFAHAEFLVRNRFLGEAHQQIIRERGVIQRFIKELAGRLDATRNHMREIVRIVRRLVQILACSCLFRHLIHNPPWNRTFRVSGWAVPIVSYRSQTDKSMNFTLKENSRAKSSEGQT